MARNLVFYCPKCGRIHGAMPADRIAVLRAIEIADEEGLQVRFEDPGPTAFTARACDCGRAARFAVVRVENFRNLIDDQGDHLTYDGRVWRPTSEASP